VFSLYNHAYDYTLLSATLSEHCIVHAFGVTLTLLVTWLFNGLNWVN